MNMLFNRKHIAEISHFRRFEQILALFLITIPAILWIVEGELKPSISEYVLMTNSYVFGSLLTIAAMLYIFTGILYYKEPSSLVDDDRYKGQLYHVLIGLSLMGVVFFPCSNPCTKYPHYFMAICFFVGNALVIASRTNERDRLKNRLIAVLVLIPFLLYFILKYLDPATTFTLFWAEWVSLTVIGIHYFFEAKGVISLNLNEG